MPKGILYTMVIDNNKVVRFLETRQKSREWLADQLDCSIRTVDSILAGKIPRGVTLITLARLVGCQVEDLIARQTTKRSAW